MISNWEMIGVFLSVVYLVFALRENRTCFIAGLISSGIFTVLFFNTQLYMESGLQLYYVFMSVYGWWQWREGGDKKEALIISRWTMKEHFFAVSLIISLSCASAFFLANNTQASYPFFDSIVTWGSLITTYMVTRKILENWIYWVALDTLALCLYFNKALYLTAGLFAFFVVLAIAGHYRWLNKYHLEAKNSGLPLTLGSSI